MGNQSSLNNHCFGEGCNLWEIYSNEFAPEQMLARAELEFGLAVTFLEHHVPQLYDLNPALVDQLLEDIHLEGFEPARSMFLRLQKSWRKKQRTLQPIVAKLVCVSKRYPPLCEWMHWAVQQGYFSGNSDWLATPLPYERKKPGRGHPLPPPETIASFLRVLLHTMLLFEVLGTWASDSFTFREGMVAYYRAQISEHTGVSRFLHPAYIKTFSVDKAYNLITSLCAAEGSLKEELIATARFTLTVNILEAVVYDRHNGVADRSAAGYALVANPIGRVSVQPTTGHILVQMSAEYAMLYLVWNLSYILQFAHPNLYIAKLLQPLVFCAAPDKFIFFRMHSLYMAANSSTLDAYQNRTYLAALPQGPWVQKLIDINLRYARHFFAQSHSGENLTSTFIAKHLADIPSFIRNLHKFVGA
jgi:hypothetical protein